MGWKMISRQFMRLEFSFIQVFVEQIVVELLSTSSGCCNFDQVYQSHCHYAGECYHDESMQIATFDGRVEAVEVAFLAT
jgi:hypothetical protein